jgi:DNA repair exonuclease SbcCD ATPase subunit
VRPGSVPHTISLNSEARAFNDAVAISSDYGTANPEPLDDVSDAQHFREQDESFRTSDEDINAGDEPEEHAQLQSQQGANSSPVQSIESVGAEDDDAHLGLENGSDTASAGVVPRSMLNIPRTPRRQTTSSPLTQPSRVTKTRGVRTHNPSVVTIDLPQDREDNLPSTQDVLGVLAKRMHKKSAAAQESDRRAKQLESRLFHLINSNRNLQNENNALTAGLHELGDRNVTLQEEVDNFAARYTKIKTFAKDAHSQLLALRESANTQHENIRTLAEVKAAIKIAVQQASKVNRENQLVLTTQKRSLNNIRSETQKMSVDLVRLTKDNEAKSTRIVELNRDKGRLEAHTINLQYSQERSKQNVKDVLFEVAANVQNLTTEVAGIRDGPPVPVEAPANPVLGFIAFLLLSLLKNSAKERQQISDLSENLRLFQHMVVQVANSFDGRYKALLEAKETVSMRNILETLQKQCRDVLTSAQSNAQIAIEKARLKDRLEGAVQAQAKLVEDLSQAKSDSASFKTALDKVSSYVEEGKEKETQLKSDKERFQLRWSSAKSELAETKQTLCKTQENLIHTREELEAHLAFQQLYISQGTDSSWAYISRNDVEEFIDDTKIELIAEVNTIPFTKVLADI